MPRARAKKPLPKTYRVVGDREVAGHTPGETFTANYSAEHEQYLIQAGHVEITQPEATANGDDTVNDNSKEE